MQIVSDNNDYEILTPYGWESFDSIFKNESINIKSRRIIFDDGSCITATLDHRFFQNNVEIKVCDIEVGYILDATPNNKQVTDIIDIILEDTYEIFNTPSHTIFVNNIVSHQCDEFGFVKDNIANDFWGSIQPTLSTGGQCIITSTPNGDKNLFAQLWRGAENGVNGFMYKFVQWDAVPGRGEEFKEDMIKTLGLITWEQEFLCNFISSDPLLINTNVLLNYKVCDPEHVEHNGVKWYEKIITGGKYLVGVDPATGAGKDYSTMQIFEFPSLRQVAEFRSNTISSGNFYDVLKQTLLKFEAQQCVVYFSIENNGIGEALVTLYDMDDTVPENAEFISESGKNRRGFTTTKRIKTKCCILLKELIESGKMQIKSVDLITEFKSFVSKNNTYTAKHGSTDDLISAVLIIIRILDEISMYEEGVYEKIYKYAEIDEFSLSDNNQQDNEPNTFFFTGGSVPEYYQSNMGALLDPNDPNSWDPFGDMY